MDGAYATKNGKRGPTSYANRDVDRGGSGGMIRRSWEQLGAAGAVAVLMRLPRLLLESLALWLSDVSPT